MWYRSVVKQNGQLVSVSDKCSKKCRNGGRCVSSGKCDCKPGFYGRYCQKREFTTATSIFLQAPAKVWFTVHDTRHLMFERGWRKTKPVNQEGFFSEKQNCWQQEKQAKLYSLVTDARRLVQWSGMSALYCTVVCADLLQTASTSDWVGFLP